MIQGPSDENAKVQILGNRLDLYRSRPGLSVFRVRGKQHNPAPFDVYLIDTTGVGHVSVDESCSAYADCALIKRSYVW